MAIIYKKLFNIAMRHDFYTSGISRDLVVAPTTLTSQIMKDNKLLFKHDDTGIRVLYRAKTAGSDDSFIDFSNLELRFTMGLNNVTEFINFTKLNLPAQDFKQGNLLYFTNTVITDHELTYSIIDMLRPNMFTYEFPQTGTVGDLGNIKIYNEAGTDVTPVSPDPNNIEPTGEGKFLYTVDLSDLPAGLFTFTTQKNALPTESKKVYIDNDLTGTNVFGIIKIKATNALPASFPAADVDFDARQYNAVFTRRNSTWRYIVVPKITGIAAADLAVIDGEASPPAPYGPGAYTFSPAGTVFVNEIESAVFESTVEIPFYEVPKKGIYVENTSGPNKVLDNITNPARQVISADAGDFGTTVIYVIV